MDRNSLVLTFAALLSVVSCQIVRREKPVVLEPMVKVMQVGKSTQTVSSAK